jgi:hypothetical protein
MDKGLALFLHAQEVLSWNTGPETDHPDWGTDVFPSFLTLSRKILDSTLNPTKATSFHIIYS